jgi:predicted RNase H-like nuclease (RuvC/YqgF family)
MSELTERILSEAAISDRPGGYYRLETIAADVAALERENAELLADRDSYKRGYEWWREQHAIPLTEVVKIEHRRDAALERIEQARKASEERDTQIEQLITDLDRARADGGIYTYGNIQTRLRDILKGATSE